MTANLLEGYTFFIYSLFVHRFCFYRAICQQASLRRKVLTWTSIFIPSFLLLLIPLPAHLFKIKPPHLQKKVQGNHESVTFQLREEGIVDSGHFKFWHDIFFDRPPTSALSFVFFYLSFPSSPIPFLLISSYFVPTLSLRLFSRISPLCQAC